MGITDIVEKLSNSVSVGGRKKRRSKKRKSVKRKSIKRKSVKRKSVKKKQSNKKTQTLIKNIFN